MKLNEFLRIILLSSLFLLFFSGTGRIKNLDLKPDEAIIIAKIQINNGNSYLGNKWNFLFDERLWAKWAVWPDENNYIYMKVPIGKHFIALLQYKSYHLNLPDNYLTIEIKESKIYYIGDIVLYWNINYSTETDNYNGGGIAGGVKGALSDSKKPGNNVKVDVNDNYDEALKYFNSKFENHNEIQKVLLKINNGS